MKYIFLNKTFKEMIEKNILVKIKFGVNYHQRNSYKFIAHLQCLQFNWSDSIEVSMVYQPLLCGCQPRHSHVGLLTFDWKSFRRGRSLNLQVYTTPPVSFQHWPNGSFYGISTSIIRLTAKTFRCQISHFWLEEF